MPTTTEYANCTDCCGGAIACDDCDRAATLFLAFRSRSYRTSDDELINDCVIETTMTFVESSDPMPVSGDELVGCPGYWLAEFDCCGTPQILVFYQTTITPPEPDLPYPQWEVALYDEAFTYIYKGFAPSGDQCPVSVTESGYGNPWPPTATVCGTTIGFFEYYWFFDVEITE